MFGHVKFQPCFRLRDSAFECPKIWNSTFAYNNENSESKTRLPQKAEFWISTCNNEGMYHKQNMFSMILANTLIEFWPKKCFLSLICNNEWINKDYEKLNDMCFQTEILSHRQVLATWLWVTIKMCGENVNTGFSRFFILVLSFRIIRHCHILV